LQFKTPFLTFSYLDAEARGQRFVFPEVHTGKRIIGATIFFATDGQSDANILIGSC